MSEESTTPATVETTSAPVDTTPAETTSVDTTQTTEATTETTTEAPPAPKFEYPKKFLKEDGTVDHERLAQSYVALEKKISSKGNIPASSIEEYSYDFGDLAPHIDGAVSAEFKQTMLDKKFNAEQYGFMMDRFKEVVEDLRPNPAKVQATLKAEWGDNYESHASAANRAFEEFAPSDANPRSPIWSDPTVIKLLARIGSELGEDSVSAKPKAVSGTGDSIDAQIAELRAQPNWHSDQAVQAKLNALYEKKYQ